VQTEKFPFARDEKHCITISLLKLKYIKQSPSSEVNGHSAINESPHTFQNPTAASIATKLQAGQSRNRGPIPSSKNADTASVAHPASYSVGTVGSYTTDKVVRL
jgi:hypothetical protein